MSIDERTQKLGEMLAELRNKFQGCAESIDAFLNYLGQSMEPSAVKEETFNILKFEPQKGERLGEFEIARKANNIPDKWSHAFNILRQNNATIKNRYHGPDYTYSYWLYKEDQIYRQKLKGSEAKAAPAAARTAVPSNIFPKDLAEMLSFEETKDWIIVKPRQFVGSENFSKIAAIVREHSGEYISAGKESHFRLPKTPTK